MRKLKVDSEATNDEKRECLQEDLLTIAILAYLEPDGVKKLVRVLNACGVIE